MKNFASRGVIARWMSRERMTNLGGESDLGHEASEQIDRGLGRGIDFDLLDLGEFSRVRDKDAVDGAVGRNRNAVDEGVNRVAKKFETRDQRDIERSGGEPLAKGGGMIEDDLARPPVNERTRVEILNATDP